MKPPKLREQWLQRATAKLRKAWAARGVTVPADVRVTCGFPGGGSPMRRIGECWPRGRSAHGVNEVLINPTVADSLMALDVLGHELLHAVDDCQSGHGTGFSRASRMVGYSGGKRSAIESPEAKKLAARIIKSLGAYPHGEVALVKKTRNASHGLHKLECGCGNSVYATAKKLEDFGFPSCGQCGEELQPQTERSTKSVVRTI